MPIENTNPVTVPARAEKTYPKLWLERFETAAPTSEGARVAATLKPYTDSSGFEFAPGVEATFWADGNVFTLHLRRPDLDAVVGAVLDNFAAIRAASPSNTLAMMELLAQVIGAVAQAPVEDEIPLATE
jgi:hypothetical protein